MGRSSILAALANAVFLLVAIGGITWEAFRRFSDPTPVAGGTLALDAVPTSTDPAAVRQYFEGMLAVTIVHDLHIWALSTMQTALTVHLVKHDAEVDDALLAHACEELREKFGISHATIQLERGDATHPCQFAPAHVV